MNHPYVTLLYAEMRQRELLQRAETYRLVKMLKADRRNWLYRCCNLFSGVGLMLKTFIQPNYLSIYEK